VHGNLKTRIFFPAVLRCNPLLTDLLHETVHAYYTETSGTWSKVGFETG
jgi:hypothetical protein